MFLQRRNFRHINKELYINKGYLFMSVLTLDQNTVWVSQWFLSVTDFGYNKHVLPTGSKSEDNINRGKV